MVYEELEQIRNQNPNTPASRPPSNTFSTRYIQPDPQPQSNSESFYSDGRSVPSPGPTRDINSPPNRPPPMPSPKAEVQPVESFYMDNSAITQPAPPVKTSPQPAPFVQPVSNGGYMSHAEVRAAAQGRPPPLTTRTPPLPPNSPSGTATASNNSSSPYMSSAQVKAAVVSATPQQPRPVQPSPQPQPNPPSASNTPTLRQQSSGSLPTEPRKPANALEEKFLRAFGDRVRFTNY